MTHPINKKIDADQLRQKKLYIFQVAKFL